MENAIVNQEELQKCFMLDIQYGTRFNEWPHSTILLCQFRIETELRKAREITLVRFDNTPGTHAEKLMIAYFERKFEELPPDYRVKLFMILSYSPCKDCSNDILDFMERYNQCSIEIKFSNFYKCYRLEDSQVNGIHRLHMKGVQLSVFCGINDWKCFIRDQLGFDPGLIDAHYTNKRKDREFVDLCILQVIKSSTANYDSRLVARLIARISQDVMSFFF